jgi:hypothetical protein|tara:strand:+ start:140 stop:277 length:138 start_codon:yes stop_codon:yes gene_type:complete
MGIKIKLGNVKRIVDCIFPPSKTGIYTKKYVPTNKCAHATEPNKK